MLTTRYATARPLAVLAIVASMAGAGAAWADTAAMVIGNASYDEGPRVDRAQAVAEADRRLDAAGIDATILRDAGRDGMRRAVERFEREAPDADRLLVALSGRFVRTAQETYFLPVDVPRGPLTTLPRAALPLSVVLSMLSIAPGEAVLVIGRDPEEDGRVGPFVSEGVGRIDPPQGVTVLIGTPDIAARVLREVLAEPGVLVAPVVARTEGLTHRGYLRNDQAFLPAQDDDAEARQAEAAAREDDAAWARARDADDLQAYRDYLGDYPRGRHVATARDRLSALQAEPFRTQRLDEAALALDTEARRAIQRDLSLIGYETRGIDGIFGPGTRGAIRTWQGQNGIRETGYLTEGMIAQIGRQAGQRAGELEQERQQRAEARDREDRAYWESTGAGGSEEGLLSYLNRFPDGRFAQRAESQLVTIRRADSNNVPTQSSEEALWRRVADLDSVKAYRAYLRRYPDGRFAGEAQRRIDRRGGDGGNGGQAGPSQAQIDAALGVEQRLGLNEVTRRAVEQRLGAVGLDPGRVDGKFDGGTRRAIRRYQQAAALPVTGYLDQTTVVRLLADSLRDTLNR